jgi:hypothetical protein
MLVDLTPLWPAGHLPLKGGDHPISMNAQILRRSRSSVVETCVISPLEGEMAGRPEGGA